MLRKLLKHEFRATGRTMLPMYLIVLAASLGANLTTRGLLETEYPILDTIGVILVMLFVVAIIAVCVMAFVTMIERFYKNVLKDEGYLTMTLPVSVHQQVCAKLLVSIVWFVLTALMVALAFCIMAFNLEAVHEVVGGMRDILGRIWQSMSAYYALNGTAILVETMVLTFLGLAAVCLRFYASMAIGHSFANHKLLLSVVFFFAIGAVEQFLTVSGFRGLNWLQDHFFGGEMIGFGFVDGVFQHSGMAVTHMMFGISIVSQLVLAGIFYFLTTYCLKNRLNLE